MKFSSLRQRARATLLSCACAAVPMAASAGAGVLTTTVTPLSPAVTYSALASASPARPALDTYIGYTVSIANAGGNTINNISFTGSTRVTDGDEKAVFSSIEGAACTAPTTTTIRCVVGQLKAGQSFPSFAVFFKAPVKDTASPLPDGLAGSCASTDCVIFSGITAYAETTGGPKSPVDNSMAEWAAGEVTLGTFNPTQVKSAVQKGGGTVFVGSCASPTTPRSDGVPCIAKRTYYKSSRTPGWTPELDGDFEWTLINLGNGSYKVF
jgi:hypothetical protein